MEKARGKKKKREKLTTCLKTANHGKKKQKQKKNEKHIQMAQEIVVNYDEAQRDKSTPGYTVQGA